MSTKSAARKARRAARKTERSARKAKLSALVSAAEHATFTVDLDASPPPKFIQVFDEVWPVLEPALAYVESLKITGDKSDQALEALIALGNQVKNGASETEQNKFVADLDKVWRYVNMGLGVLKVVVNDKADATIDDIIDIGDWLTGNESDADTPPTS